MLLETIRRAIFAGWEADASEDNQDNHDNDNTQLLHALSLAQLRNLIDDEGLCVAKNVGGRNRRTKLNLIEDITSERRRQNDGGGKQRDASLAAVKRIKSKPRASWQLDGGAGAWCVGESLRVTKCTLKSLKETSPEGTSFLSLWLGGRLVSFELGMPTSRANTDEALPPSVIFTDGKKLELVARKVDTDSGGAGRFFGRKTVTLHYAVTESPNMPSINLASRLTQFAAFDMLPNGRKAASRLELLCSRTSGCGAKAGAMHLRHDDFEVLELESSRDVMADGCGFIGDEVLTKLYGDAARVIVSLQVRVIAPRLGLFKGVLMRSPFTDKIQLTPSMRKVPAAQQRGDDEDDDDEWALLLVRMMHPTTHNMRLGERIRGEAPRASPKTPMHNRKKPLSDMVSLLLTTLDVPPEHVESLTARSRRNDYSADFAWLVGVADPTGNLPEGHVYVTGMPADNLSSERIFVTRSPCVKPEDGRLLPIVCSTKPRGIDNVSWDWLSKLPFGALIFSTKGNVPLPSLCADGDLDGDYYFVCWDENILAHVKPRDVAKATKESRRTNASARDVTLGEQWLVEAQRHMLDVSALRENIDVCKLYRRWEQCCRTSQSGMDDPDARCYADAYVQALEHDKHGSGYHMGPKTTM
ncbi:RNA-dependent RNA polymerase [Pycnococcus provasolii]